MSEAALVSDLLSIDPNERRSIYRDFTPREMKVLVRRARRELGTPYGIWQDDPRGFIEDVLGDTMWTRQVEIAEAVRDHQRVAVPAGHSPGKSWLAGRLAAWFATVYPLGTAKVLTTAPKMRQVEQIMWGGRGIRRAHAAGALPGIVTAHTWKVGADTLAYGFSPAEWDEDAVQGEHAPHLLLIVDEAGGIGHVLGRAYTSLMSQPHPRLLLLGNPPTDEEGSWFELQSEKSEFVKTIRISAYDTPNFTGEETGPCSTCPPGVAPHPVADHLTTHEWVQETIDEFGEDAAYVIARVHAQFPRGAGRKAIPYAWVELAADMDHEPAPGTWVRLGADIASDGGDEFAIARAVGYAVEIIHRSSGASNSDAVQVAGVVTQHTREACELRDRLGDEQDVHVKIDASTLGWGVAALVKRQCAEMSLPARVLGVRGEDKPNDEAQFKNARSELWWNMRRLMRPVTDPSTGQVTQGGKVKLVNATTKLTAQLQAPNYENDSAGRTVVEKKRDMRVRGVQSPDLADAVNLALWEPPGQGPASVDRAPQTRVPTRPTEMTGTQGAQVIPLGPTRR